MITLECRTSIFPAYHAGSFRIFREFSAPAYAILLQRGKTKLLSTEFESRRYIEDKDYRDKYDEQERERREKEAQEKYQKRQREGRER